MSRHRKPEKPSADEPPFIAPRNSVFNDMITATLSLGDLTSHYMNPLNFADADTLNKTYSAVFTSVHVSPEDNYEYYEQLGDVIIGQFIVWYSYRRFPRLKCYEGVKVVARIRINYGSRDTLSKIADSLGFWDYISSYESHRATCKKDLLEDVFEAFIGATASIVDSKFEPGDGYKFVYMLLSAIFDKIHISLKYNDLFDAKTRLKELFDFYKEPLGVKPIYKNIRNDNDRLTESIIYREDPRMGKIEIGRSKAPRQADAEQQASEMAFAFLTKRGYKKPVLPIYD